MKRRAAAAAPAAAASRPRRAKVTKPAARVTAAPKPAKLAKPAAAAAAVAPKRAVAAAVPAEAEADRATPYQQRIARAVSHALEQHKSRPKSVGKKQACLLAAKVAAKECVAIPCPVDVQQIVDKKLQRAPNWAGGPAPWEWAILSDGTRVSTAWGAARTDPNSPFMLKMRALEAYLRRTGLSIERVAGRRCWLLRDVRLAVARDAAAAVAAELKCPAPELGCGERRSEMDSELPEMPLELRRNSNGMIRWITYDEEQRRFCLEP